MKRSVPHPAVMRAAIAAVVTVSSLLPVPLGAADPSFIAGPTTEFTVGFGASPQSFVLRDMNGDGLADMVSINQITGEAAVLLSAGNGTFAEPKSVRLEIFPTAITVANLNGDAYLDAAVTDDDGGVSLLFGNPDGSLRLNEQIDPGIELVGVTAGDLDEDGFIDLVVLEVCDEMILQRNLGNGSFDCFDEEFVETGSLDPIGIVNGDVNGDHHLDLLVLNRAGENVSLLRGNGDGTFQPAVLFPVGPGPRAFALGRVDNDGLDDIVVVDAGFVTENVTVFLGDMQNGLRATDKSVALANASAVALADFNGDRCLDFVSPSLEETNPALGVGDCSGRFAAPLMTPMLGFALAVQAADIDGDRRPDFVTVDDDGSLVSTALNQTAYPCAGDCDASGAVTINELVTGVNILLDRQAVEQCAVMDANNDGRVSVDELVRAVNNLLRNCSATLATKAEDAVELGLGHGLNR